MRAPCFRAFSSKRSRRVGQCTVLALIFSAYATQYATAQTFTPAADMLFERVYHTLTRLADGRILAAGDNREVGLTAAELYDPSTGRWSLTGSMKAARQNPTATLLPNGTVLFAGGQIPNDILSSAELYDPVSGTWSETGSLTMPRADHIAALLKDGRVLVAGGAFGVRSSEIYDPQTGRWILTGSMVRPRWQLKGVALLDGRVLVAGGIRDSTAEVYDPATGTWSLTGPLDYPVGIGHSMTRLADGRVLLLGGGGDGGPPDYSLADIFDPATNRWTLTTPMPRTSTLHSAALLLDGTVLITGNTFCNTPSCADALLFDPASETWTRVGGAFAADTQAVRLFDGRILVSGGWFAGNSITAKAFLFTGGPGAVIPTLNVSVTAPPALSVLNGSYDGNPFTVTGRVTNTGAATAAGVDVSISLPGGLTLASGSLTQSIATLAPGQHQDFAWTVRASGQTHDTTLSYFVTLASSNAAGTNVSRRIMLPGNALTVDSITPTAGGDDGSVTIHVNGGGIRGGATARLVRNGEADIVGQGVNASADGYGLTSTFDLSGKSNGAWDLIVANPDGTAANLTNAFAVEGGRAADVWVDIVGPDAVRVDRSTSLYINYGNDGNVNAGESLLVIAGVPNEAEVEVDGQAPPMSEGVAVQNLTNLGDVSAANANSSQIVAQTPQIVLGDFLTIPLPVLPVGPAATYTLRLRVRLPGGQPWELRVWMFPMVAVLPPNPWTTLPSSCLAVASKAALKAMLDLIPGNACVAAFRRNFIAAFFDLLTREENRNRELSEQEKMMLFQQAMTAAARNSVGDCAVSVNAIAAFVNDIANFGAENADSVFDCVRQLVAQSNGRGTPFPVRHRVNMVGSVDPNDKFGPSGFAQARYVSGGTPLPFDITFENLETASAPAQEVVISDPLNRDVFDLSTFSLGPIGFGDILITPPAGLNHYTTDVDLRPTRNLVARINAGLDTSTGLATWRFSSFDPATMLPTDDPLAGFLPPNVTSPEGQGSVLFTVNPKSNLPTGTEIRNKATIVFDTSAPINTPEWVNTIDSDKPRSHVGDLPPTTASPDYLVQWSSADFGAGVQDVTVFVSENSGSFTPFVTNSPDTSATFHGQVGKTYAFYSIARDLVGNVENPKSAAEATTTVIAADSTPPVLVVNTPVDGARIAALSVTVTGTASDASAVSLTVNNVPVALAPDGSFSTVVTLSPGANTITVVATDAAGNSSQATRSVRANMTAPALMVGAPTDGALTASNTALVQGAATPADPQDSVTVTVQGNAVSVGGASGSFSSAAALVEGANTITVVATDGYGLQTAKGVNVIRDTTPPQIALSGVADGQISNAASLTPAFSASDEHPGEVTATLDGAPFASGTPVASEGAHLLAVHATDAAGNQSGIQVHFTLDRTPPAITLAGVTDGQRRNTPATIVFSGTDTNLAGVSATLDGVPFASGSTVAAEGSHIVSVHATDMAGNSASKQVSFTIDTTPPVITVLAPANGTLTNNPIVAFRVMATDAGGIGTVQEGSIVFVSAPDGSYNATLSLAEGPNQVDVAAIDTAGNAAHVRVTVTVDTIPPALVVTSPIDGARIGALTATVTGSISDSSAVSLTVNGVPVPLGSGGAFSTVVALSVGANAITAIATDAAGNATTDSRQVRANVIPPALALTAPSSGLLTNASSVNVQGTASAADAQDSVVVTVQGHQVTVQSGIFSTATPLIEGTNTIAVIATDGYGLQTTAGASVVRDTTPPVITVSGVQDGQLSNGARIVPAFSATDDHLATVTATLDGQPFMSGNPVTMEGSHQLVVSATDAAGNASNVQVNFAIDRMPPQIAVSGVQDGQLSNAASLTPTFSATDTNLASVIGTLDGAPFASGTPVSAEGMHLLVVTATDLAGNQSRATLHFTLDRTPPLITIFTPADGARVAALAATVNGTVSDANAVSLTINGAALARAADGSFSTQVALTPGANTITVVATDAAGNSAAATRQVRANIVPPTLTLSAPQNGLVTNGSSVQVQGIATPADPNDSVLVTVKGNPVSVQSDGNFSTAVALSDGANMITVVATDGYGLRTTAAVSIVQDATPPVAACSPFERRGDRDDDDDDGLFRVTGSDAVGPVTLKIGPYVLANGALIRLSLKRQSGVAEVGRAKDGIQRFRVGSGDAHILATDGAGNATNAICPLDREERRDRDEKERPRERE